MATAREDPPAAGGLHDKQVGWLVVIAGPSGTGKKTLIGALERNEAPEAVRAFGIDDLASWPWERAASLARQETFAFAKLLLQYDIVAQFLLRGRGRRYVDPFEIGEHVDVFTI